MPKPTALKRAIFDSGRTQKDIAGEAGVDEAYLSRMVNGLHGSHDARRRISDVLDVPASDLWPDEVAA